MTAGNSWWRSPFIKWPEVVEPRNLEVSISWGQGPARTTAEHAARSYIMVLEDSPIDHQDV
jgi:hypothetical protein